MSAMYDGAMLLRDLQTKMQSLNSKHPLTDSQCRLISASVTWSSGRSPYTSQAAEFKTCCNSPVVRGNFASTALL